MNDFGKGEIQSMSSGFIMMFIGILVYPFFESNGFTSPLVDFDPLQLSEFVYWLMAGVFILLSLHVISNLASAVCCYAVYFINRAWFFYKLRKPERVYTGDLL